MKKSTRKRLTKQLNDPNRAYTPLGYAIIATPLIKVRGAKSKALREQVYKSLIELNQDRIMQILEKKR